MSAQELRKVVSRAVLDEGFRRTLYSNPDQILQGYDLTEDEIGALRAMPAETIDDFASNLEERISMSLLSFSAELFGGEIGGADAFGKEVSGAEAGGFSSRGGEITGAEAQGSEAAGWTVYGNELGGAEGGGFGAR